MSARASTWHSQRWKELKWRNDDIVICSYAKAGTTLTQQVWPPNALTPCPGLRQGASAPCHGLPLPRPTPRALSSHHTHSHEFVPHITTQLKTVGGPAHQRR